MNSNALFLPRMVMATNNGHKLSEAREICKGVVEILSLEDIGCREDIPETGATLRENALQKASYVKEKYGYDCFADDTGLIVDSLDGAPGVYSARYAGEGHDAHANMQKLLREMEGKENRNAHFSTVIAVIRGTKIEFVEGRVDGKILHNPKGCEGFGYDPVFQPDGYEETFAEMTSEDKNKISHRGRAMRKLLEIL